MRKRRNKQLEEEALEQGLTPTKDLKADEEKPTYDIPWSGIFVVGAILVLVIVCVIVLVIFRK